MSLWVACDTRSRLISAVFNSVRPVGVARLRSKVITQGKHHHKNGSGGNQDFGGQAVLHRKLPFAEEHVLVTPMLS